LYTYRFQVPDSKTYDISFVKMTRKNTESIKWNLIDSYICIQGNGSLTPSELKKMLASTHLSNTNNVHIIK